MHFFKKHKKSLIFGILIATVMFLVIIVFCPKLIPFLTPISKFLIGSVGRKIADLIDGCEAVIIGFLVLKLKNKYRRSTFSSKENLLNNSPDNSPNNPFEKDSNNLKYKNNIFSENKKTEKEDKGVQANGFFNIKQTCGNYL